MIYQFSKRTIEYLTSLSGQSTDQDQLDVYIYGLECFINTAVPVTLLTILSLFTECLFETWLWLFVFSVLREYTGGYHASTQFACMTSSTLLGIGNTFISQYINFSSIFVTSCYLLCIIVVLILCPIPSSKKELDMLQRKRYKKRALEIVSSCLLLSLLLPNNYALTLMYSCLSCIFLVVIEMISRILSIKNSPLLDIQ